MKLVKVERLVAQVTDILAVFGQDLLESVFVLALLDLEATATLQAGAFCKRKTIGFDIKHLQELLQDSLFSLPGRLSDSFPLKKSSLSPSKLSSGAERSQTFTTPFSEPRGNFKQSEIRITKLMLLKKVP